MENRLGDDWIRYKITKPDYILRELTKKMKVAKLDEFEFNAHKPRKVSGWFGWLFFGDALIMAILVLALFSLLI